MLLKKSIALTLLLIGLTPCAQSIKTNQLAQADTQQLMPQPSRIGVKKMTDPKSQADHAISFAYVMSVQWVGPLVSMDYSAEWNLLWRLGLSELNANDDYPNDTPATI